jgi:photosystem II stability/assembly factor-like uncharacterized protein
MSIVSRRWYLLLVMGFTLTLPFATGSNRSAMASSPTPRADQGWQAAAYISATGGTIYDATFLDAANGWAVGSNGGLYQTTDSGSTWTTKVTGITNDLDQIVFPDAQDGFARGSGIILQTTNGGTTWQPLTATIPQPITSMSVPSSSMIAVYATPNDRPDGIYISTNSGISWTLSLHAENINQVLFTSPSNGWVVGSNVVSRTIDGGASWQTVLDTTGQVGYHAYYRHIQFVSSSVGFLFDAVDDFNQPAHIEKVLRTADGGSSWQDGGIIRFGTTGGACYGCDSMAFGSATAGLIGISSNYPLCFKLPTAVRRG